MQNLEVPKKRGRPANDNMRSANVRLPADLYVGVRAFIAQQNVPPRNFSAAIRIILREWLVSHNYLP